jgi:hypothetical protein
MRPVAAGVVGLILLPCCHLPAQEAAPPAATLSVAPPGAIIARVRAAGFEALHWPVLRGRVYVVFARNPYLMDVQLKVDPRTGNVLSVTRLAGAAYGGPILEKSLPDNALQRAALPVSPRAEPAVAAPRPTDERAIPENISRSTTAPEEEGPAGTPTGAAERLEKEQPAVMVPIAPLE